MIVDEIVIGFGYMGYFFVCMFEDVIFDIFCLGKVLMGGYLLIVVMFFMEKLYFLFFGFLEVMKIFYYGYFYVGNLFGCVVVLVSL